MSNTFGMLESNIRELCKQIPNMTSYDFENALIRLISFHLGFMDTPSLINKMDFESIRSYSVQQHNSSYRLFWQSEGPSKGFEVTPEQLRLICTIRGTLDFLYSKKYLVKKLKLNISTDSDGKDDW